MVSVTEKWNPHARIRQELIGFINMLAIKDGKTLAIQSTSSSSFADRRKKVLDHEKFIPILSAGWLVAIHE